MAKFIGKMPTELIKEFEMLESRTEEMLEEMTKAGADVVYGNMSGSIPSVLRGNLIKTRTYKTPSDDGINTKVMVSGYFFNENNKLTPAPLVANLFEYGRSNSPYPKRPFLRRSFTAGTIKSAMLAVQKRYIKD
jgi:hypothetical protein